MIDDSDKIMRKINDKVATAIEHARELGWHEGVKAEKDRAREARRNSFNPEDAAPASFINLAFDSGRVHERHRAETILRELQLDVPIDGPAYELVQKALAELQRGSNA